MKPQQKAKAAVIIGLIILGLVANIVLGIIFMIGAIFDGNANVFPRYVVMDSSEHMSEKVNIDLDVRGEIDDKFGQWQPVYFFENQGAKIKIEVSGEVSLCQAFLPVNNLQQSSNLAVDGSYIPIPRVGDSSTKGLGLIFDSSNNSWRNVAKVDSGDEIFVAITGNTTSSSQIFFNQITSSLVGPVNCSEGTTTYSPLCGRFTMWSSYIDYYWPVVFNVSEATHESYNSSTASYQDQSQNVTHCCRCNPVSVNQPVSYLQDNSRTVDTNVKYSSLNSLVPSKSFGPETQMISDPVIGVNYYKCRSSGSSDTQHSTGSGCLSVNSGNYHEVRPNTITNYYCTLPPQLSTANYGTIDTWPRGDRRSMNTYNYIKDIVFNNNVFRNRNNITTTRDLNSQVTNPYKTGVSWYTSGLGLVSRVSNSSAASSTLGTGYKIVNPEKIDAENNFGFDPDKDYYIPNEFIFTNNQFYQLKFLSRQDVQPTKSFQNLGGYIVYVKQTKCKRKDGNFFTDTRHDGTSVADRGRIQLLWAPYTWSASDTTTSVTNDDINTYFDPNKYTPVSSLISEISLTSGALEYTVPRTGVLWMRVKNHVDDYKNSIGSYNVKISAPVASINDGFLNKVITPMITMLKDFMLTNAEQMFQNMTCYKTSDTSRCNDIFTYIRAMLTLYIMSYGLLFLVGSVQISHYDLSIRLIKIVIVSGLITGSSFEYFHNYIMPLIWNTTSQLISNIGGFEKNDMVFAFADQLLTDVFLNPSFVFKILALYAVGIHGIFYFLAVIISITLFVPSIFRVIAVYVMSFVAISLLISIAPLFFTFMLFESTNQLFQNWVKYLIRYILEPVIVIGGMVILTRIFTVFLDYAMPYSVVAKCAIPIKIPFIQDMLAAIIPFAGEFLEIPIICINGFSPWGYDIADDNNMIGIDFQNFVVLLIIAKISTGYLGFVEGVVQKLLGGGPGSPSATSMGNRLNAVAPQAMAKTLAVGVKALSVVAGTVLRQKDLAKRLSNLSNDLSKGNVKSGLVRSMGSQDLADKMEGADGAGKKGIVESLVGGMKSEDVSNLAGKMSEKLSDLGEKVGKNPIAKTVAETALFGTDLANVDSAKKSVSEALDNPLGEKLKQNLSGAKKSLGQQAEKATNILKNIWDENDGSK